MTQRTQRDWLVIQRALLRLTTLLRGMTCGTDSTKSEIRRTKSETNPNDQIPKNSQAVRETKKSKAPRNSSQPGTEGLKVKDQN
jgi:hypothetical protein